MAVAVFDYDAWAALFPELAAGGVTEPIATMYFGIAGLLFDNSDCSQIADPVVRLSMLNYVVAHLASLGGYPLAAGASAPAPTGIVGRISSATEGSVSISSELGATSNSQAFWVQTQYGATFWQLTRGLRTMRYVAAPPRNFGPRGFPWGNGGPGGYGGRGW